MNRYSKERVDYGKVAEKHISNRLKSWGYKVEDISQTMTKYDSETEFQSPFDLLITYKSSMFLADVKHLSITGARVLFFNLRKLTNWRMYSSPCSMRHRLIICSLSLRTDVFVLLEDIEKRSDYIGPNHFALDINRLDSLVAMRTWVEDAVIHNILL